MSKIQKQHDELRFIEKNKLKEESRVIGNYYKDVIRAYGVDANYYKLKTPFPEIFSKIVSDNSLLKHAYGYEGNKDYSISAKVITYLEVENDIFELNKFGSIPSTEVNFYFENIDFATALASELGKFKEYKIKEEFIQIEFDDTEFDKLNIKKEFASDILTGLVEIPLNDVECELDKETTIQCDVIKVSAPHLDFPVNEDLYKSFNYHLGGKAADDIIVNFTFTVHQIENTNKFVLNGMMKGAVLFRDLTLIGKYYQEIHPEVGDIVTIDFPDGRSREQFQITECTDKNITSDGLNPLLHRYIWKCKAKRYTPTKTEIFYEENLANKQVQEKIDLENAAMEEIVKQISEYNDWDDDKVYGGYERKQKFIDINDLEYNSKPIPYSTIDDGTLIDIFAFANNCKLCTNGYDLYFKNSKDQAINVTEQYVEVNGKSIVTDGNIQFLKATDDLVIFNNIEDKAIKICDGNYPLISSEISTWISSDTIVEKKDLGLHALSRIYEIYNDMKEFKRCVPLINDKTFYVHGFFPTGAELTGETYDDWHVVPTDAVYFKLSALLDKNSYFSQKFKERYGHSFNLDVFGDENTTVEQKIETLLQMYEQVFYPEDFYSFRHTTDVRHGPTYNTIRYDFPKFEGSPLEKWLESNKVQISELSSSFEEDDLYYHGQMPYIYYDDERFNLGSYYYAIKCHGKIQEAKDVLASIDFTNDVNDIIRMNGFLLSNDFLSVAIDTLDSITQIIKNKKPNHQLYSQLKDEKKVEKLLNSRKKDSAYLIVERIINSLAQLLKSNEYSELTSNIPYAILHQELSTEKDISAEISTEISIDLRQKNIDVMTLNSLVDLTVFKHTVTDLNKNGDNYYKFSNCKTVIFSLDDHLFCRLGNSEVYQLV